MDHQLDNNQVTLKLLGFTDADTARFLSILTLAERGLKKSWSITGDKAADFFLIKEQLIPLMDQHELLKNLPRRQCIFIMHKRDDLDTGGHQLYLGAGEVPSLRLLVEFLNQINSDGPGQPVSAPEPDFLDPEQGFLGYLLAPVSHPRAFKLPSQQDGIVLYVDVKHNCYYSNTVLDQLTPYFFAGPELKVENLTKQHLQAAVVSQALKSQPLSNLLWFTAFTCSQGKVIKGYQKGDIVYLKRWPDINLPSCRQLVKLAAYMQSNVVDLETVQAQTSLPLARIHDFYNACKVIDLIGHSQYSDTHEKNTNTEKKQLFAKIGNRLKQVMQSNTQNKNE
jgi:hypothetical protein